MRIAYYGSPPISAKLLSALIGSPRIAEVAYVVTRSDKRHARHQRLIPTAVADLIQEKHSQIPLFKQENLNDPVFLQNVRNIPINLILVFSFGRILPSSLLSLPSLMPINLHGSLLPKLRGPSPIQTALRDGFQTTGWTVQKMKESVDSGDIIAQEKIAIQEDENAVELSERMLPLGIQLLQKTLKSLKKYGKKIPLRIQSEKSATFCYKLTKKQAALPKNLERKRSHNWIRSHNPWPLAWLHYHGKKIFLIESTLNLQHSKKSQIWLQCSDGMLAIKRVKPEGKKIMSDTDFINGQKNRDKLFSIKGENLILR